MPNKSKESKDLRIIATETRSKYLKESQELRTNILIGKKRLTETLVKVQKKEPIKPITSKKVFFDLLEKSTQPLSEEEDQK
ncbi:MAG: hypothetical protein ACRENZ_03290 [Thermodesulfobacteriota bacterium]